MKTATALCLGMVACSSSAPSRATPERPGSITAWEGCTYSIREMLLGVERHIAIGESCLKLGLVRTAAVEFEEAAFYAAHFPYEPSELPSIRHRIAALLAVAQAAPK